MLTYTVVNSAIMLVIPRYPLAPLPPCLAWFASSQLTSCELYIDRISLPGKRKIFLVYFRGGSLLRRPLSSTAKTLSQTHPLLNTNELLPCSKKSRAVTCDGIACLDVHGMCCIDASNCYNIKIVCGLPGYQNLSHTSTNQMNHEKLIPLAYPSSNVLSFFRKLSIFQQHGTPHPKLMPIRLANIPSIRTITPLF